jgi:hypothetical protein
MKKLTTQFLFIAAILAAGNLSAQVFWSQDFSGGFPAGWTTDDASGQGAVWNFCGQPDTCVAQFNEDVVATTTAANGVMVMNSDSYFALDAAGAPTTLPNNAQSRLTSSAIDCSGKSLVVCEFEMYFYTFNPDNVGKLSVSNNNVDWTDFPIPYTLGAGGAGDITANPEKIAINISTAAANQSTVYLRWEWDHNWDYWWFLDDVKLNASSSLPPLSLNISSYFLPFSHLKTPDFAIAKDTMGFFCNVKNVGGQDQNNITIKAWIYDVLNDAVLYADSITGISCPVGIDSAYALDGRFAPELPVGLYSVNYQVYVPGQTDFQPLDNVKSYNFEVTDGEWALEDGATIGYQPGSVSSDWAVANVFYMLGGSNDQYIIKDIEWRAGGAAGAITDKTAQIYIFEVKDDLVTPQWDGFDDSALLSPSFNWVGELTYNYLDTTTGNYPTIRYPITSFPNGDPGVDLKNGKRYIVTVSWEGGNINVFHTFSEAIPYSDGSVNTLIFNDQWFLGGFGADITAVIRVYAALKTTIDVNELPETVMNLFPNPTADQLNLKMNFATGTDATITIADAKGMVIRVEDKKGLTTETLSYDLTRYATGNYIARLATKEGTKTMKFTVVR